MPNELARFRVVEDQMEQATKLLKCQPDELLPRINKILAHISEIRNTLRTTHVHTLIEKIHKACTKHDGPSCKRCGACVDPSCEKCLSVDWLRNDLGIESLRKDA